jgi:hypothetical protein
MSGSYLPGETASGTEIGCGRCPSNNDNLCVFYRRQCVLAVRAVARRRLAQGQHVDKYEKRNDSAFVPEERLSAASVTTIGTGIPGDTALLRFTAAEKSWRPSSGQGVAEQMVRLFAMLTKAKIIRTSRHLRYLNSRTASMNARLAVAVKVLGAQRVALFVPRAPFVSGARGTQ